MSLPEILHEVIDALGVLADKAGLHAKVDALEPETAPEPAPPDPAGARPGPLPEWRPEPGSPVPVFQPAQDPAAPDAAAPAAPPASASPEPPPFGTEDSPHASD